MNARLRTILASSTVIFAIAAGSPAGLADQAGYGEDIPGIYGNRGHHGDGRNGRYWIPRYSGKSLGVAIVYRDTAYLRTDAQQYWGKPEWNPDYSRVCVTWYPTPDWGKTCWRVRKNDNPDRQFTANRRRP